MSNDDFAVFFYRMVFIGEDDCQWVIEDCACLLETDFGLSGLLPLSLCPIRISCELFLLI
jgi:hypothetical protein